MRASDRFRTRPEGLVLDFNLREVEQKVPAQVENWRKLPESNQRQFFREAMDGPMAFAPSSY